MNKQELHDKLVEIEQKAISKYVDNIGITDILLETMEYDEEELKQYNELHLEYYETCFYCGTNFDCDYCRDFQDDKEETNE